VGQLPDGIDPQLRLGTGVRLPAGDFQVKMPHALAPDHAFTVRPRRLQDDGGLVPMRQVQEHLSRGGGPDLLVRVDQHRTTQLPEGLGLGGRQGAQGEEERRETALHVHDAGAGSALAFDPEGAGRRRARRKDRVHVADAQQ
jgi:hypothetical protein